MQRSLGTTNNGITSGYGLLSGSTIFIFYSLLFVVGIICCFLSQIELQSVQFSIEGVLGTLTVFDLFLVELGVLQIFALWLCQSGVYARIFVYLVSTFFIGIYMAQCISFYMVHEYISRLALENLNHIGLLFNAQTFILMLVLLCICVCLHLLIELRRTVESYHKIGRFKLTCFLLLVISLFQQSSKWLPETIILQRDKILRQNNLQHTAPITSLLSTTLLKKYNNIGFLKDISFSKYELNELKKIGFIYNPESMFPLIKDSVYSGPPPFQTVPGTSQTPNIIVFFIEGFSARASAPYGTQYPNLTPHLANFAQNSMVVDNYYNHTGATYRGLHGQLCSLYPTYGGNGGWQTNYEDLPEINYLCLSHIFNKKEYETIFLDAHQKDKAQVDEMMTKLGFENVITGVELSKRYLGNAKLRGRDSLSDKQFFKGLVGYLQEREGKEKQGVPFFMGLYNLATHAFLPVTKDGKIYAKGKNQSLNTIRTLDSGFGIFWRYYKNSPYASNTIIIFTADHCHYPEKPFVEAFEGPGYQEFFVDTIPLIIHDPTRVLPKRYDARYATSLDFTPSLIHYLGLGNHKNPFMGTSIFERKDRVGEYYGVNSYGQQLYLIANDKIHKYGTSEDFPIRFQIINKFVKASKYLEVNNRLWDPRFDEQL